MHVSGQMLFRGENRAKPLFEGSVNAHSVVVRVRGASDQRYGVSVQGIFALLMSKPLIAYVPIKDPLWVLYEPISEIQTGKRAVSA